jgi:hypothetical protein
MAPRVTMNRPGSTAAQAQQPQPHEPQAPYQPPPAQPYAPQQPETPSGRAIAAANQPVFVTDSTGRQIGLRRMSALDKALLMKGLGKACDSEAYLGMVFIAAHVSSIDGQPFPPARNERQVESLIAVLDDHGLKAVGKGLESIYIDSDTAAEVDLAKNS